MICGANLNNSSSILIYSVNDCSGFMLISNTLDDETPSSGKFAQLIDLKTIL